MKYFSLGQIIFRDSYGQYSGEFTPYELSLDAGYSRLFSDRFSGALTIRYIRSDITGGGTIDGNSIVPQFICSRSGIYYQRPFKIKEMNSELPGGLLFKSWHQNIVYRRYRQAIYSG